MLQTNQGDLNFSSTSGVQFRATIVPEPASIALAASGGLVGLGWSLRRRVVRRS
ncbi:MAG: PEP-CTERM sorting domain-containing protein [Isosphaeraceae bacterium]